MNKIGKRNFTNEQLQENLDALMTALAKKKPESVKGKYFNKAQIKTSMGPTLKLNIQPYQQMISNQQWELVCVFCELIAV